MRFRHVAPQAACGTLSRPHQPGVARATASAFKLLAAARCGNSRVLLFLEMDRAIAMRWPNAFEQEWSMTTEAATRTGSITTQELTDTF